ncbi:MAG: nitrous oxide reductase family maturation protein NosD [Chloroflexi bacterium]|nr:nitrous oxide reductase family maturation protein NosD [Chloroflexota bacterium]
MVVILHALAHALALALALFTPAPALGSDAYTGPRAAAGNRLVVSPAGPYTSIHAALANARDGDTIEVRGGSYRGPLVIDKVVTLHGVGWPVIDNGGQGTVVTLASPGATLRGFEVRGSGVEPDQDHAGITLTAPRVVAEGNRLRDVLFGIYVANAPNAVVRGNDITSKPEYEQGRKGDGIRLWYSPNALVEGNTVHETRDVVIWYSEGVVLRQNSIERGRYGVHLMYCNRARIERNRLLDNSVGIFTMYSDDTIVRENLIRGQRGPSGYALGFKDSVNVDVHDNVLVDNRAGVFLDNTPFGQGYARFERNALAFNDVGVILLTNARGNTFARNTFWENVEQVSIQGQGGAAASVNTWQGNYWSDYTGFDADNDGHGEVPYHSERLFENMTDRVPSLRALIYSPAAQAVEFAAATFPVMRPQPKMTDAAPSTHPMLLPDFAAPQQRNNAGMAAVAAALLAGSGLCATLAVIGEGRLTNRQNDAPGRAVVGQGVMLQVEQLTKQYGKTEVLRRVSFEAARGEALALWGPNGAGKTPTELSSSRLRSMRARLQYIRCTP